MDLYTACTLNHPKVTDLLTLSDNLNMANKKGWTCLMYACYYGHKSLVDRIVDLDPTTLLAANNDQQTPLMIATMSGNVSIVKKTFHVDILEKPDKLGRSAMFYAVLYNQEEILEYFIEKQANCNKFECDCSLLWMKRLAAETNNEQVAREMSTAQCLMNDTADGGGGGGGDLADLKVAGARNGYGGDGGGYGANQVDAEMAADKAISVGGGAAGMTGVADGGSPRSYDDPQLVTVSSMNEDTCPGKEQPLVDGAPDAAQNSDRVLWESTKSAAASAYVLPAPLGRSPLPVLAFAFAIIIRSRRC